MFQVIYLVDVTEPLNFLIGPFFYLYIFSKVDESRIQRIYYHFLPAIGYLLYSILFHLQPIELKYNSYLEQYHPELSFVEVIGNTFEDPLLIKNFVNELTILSIAIYVIFSVIKLYKAQRKISSNSDKKKSYRILWIDIGLMTSILFIIVFVKSFYPHDLGDYIIIVAICIFIYSISFKVIRDSVFFRNDLSKNKYSKSVLDDETKQRILSQITAVMDEKYYLNPSQSLPDLAKKIKTSPNYVSQVINEKLNLTYLELINEYRIEEAKTMILDPELNETMEGIAYSVGFNSKSTFHSAFKRITGKTPSEFKNSKNN